MSELRIIGKPRRRVDARGKVTGATRYADDLAFPRMLHCRILRSPHPHALIKRVDVDRARSAPGVRLVLTGADFATRYGILPVSQDEEPICRDKVRMIGDPVAAVIARSEEEAQAALALIEVEYEPLKTIADPAEALVTDEPRIHDYGDHGNVHKAVAFEFGDVETALASADHVFEDLFHYGGNTHLALEQHAAVALLEDDGRLTLYSSTQTPHYVHRALARALDRPPHAIRVVATPNGGGFGGKTDPFHHEIIVARAAEITGRPVKICLTREEVFLCHRGRHPVTMRMRTGVKRDGSIVAMDLETLLDGGAYGSYGVASTFYTGALQTVTYHIPRYRFRGCRTFTNKPPCGPKRGHGTPQPRFGQEVQLDKIAVALQIDPADLRLRQLVPPHSLTANWMRVETIALRECIERVVDESGWRSKWQKLPEGRGVGLACGAYLCGAGLPIYWNDLPHSGVQLKLDRSGLVTLFCGATDVGQGSDDVLASIAAEIFGLQTPDIRLVTADTDLTPVDLGSYSSRVTVMAGHAAIQAAERAREMLAAAVGAKLGIPSERVVFAGGRVFDAEDPAQGVAFRDAIALAEATHGTLGTTGSYRPPKPAAQYKGGGVGPSPSYSYSAAVVEVEVDPTTGWLRVEKVWIAHDIGRALNPTLARGQVEGGVYMGLGEALMEEQALRRLPSRLSNALIHKTPSMLDYKSITTLDMPPVETFLIEQPDDAGPFGAKEVGQGPLLPIIPAVANAVFDAVGVRIDEVPITPEKILRALQSASRRLGPDHFPQIRWPEPLLVPPPWEGGDGRATNDTSRKLQEARS
jgi:4-hydroxybenzoyl-CoA reductase subunit alpha